MRFVASLAVFALCTTIFGTARAQPDDCARPDRQILSDLLDWIAAETPYDVTKTKAGLPEILFCVVGEEIPYERKTMLIEPNDQGVYDPVARRIFLVGPWSPDRPRDVAILLHELVHDVQFRNRTWPCPNATEWEAYKLHEAWLAERGLESGFDWTRIYFQSRCPRDVHP